jgi:DNA-binding CsgD family transcriptional regulator
VIFWGLGVTAMLLEREAEMADATAAVRRAVSGMGSAMVITGPLGAGKSALLLAVSQSAAEHGMQVLWAGATPQEADFAFGVAHQLLASLMSDEDGVGDRPETDAELERPLRRVCAQRPVILLVDDLQWADEPSLLWLSRLARQLCGRPMMVVFAVRQGDPRSESPAVREVVAAASCTLRPPLLSRGVTHRLVQEHLGEPGDEQFVDACHETTGGNPMFLSAILVDLAGRGVRPVAANAGVARFVVPPLLRDRVIGCLRPQPEPVRALARAIAVFGADADRDLIARFAGLEPLDCAEALRWLQRMGILAAGEMPKFVHPVVRDAIDGSMSAEEGENAHIRAAELLHSRGYPAERVAEQLLAGSASLDRWAIDALCAAADAAVRRGAPEVASRYVRRALFDSSVDGVDRARLLVQLSGVIRDVDASASVRYIAQAVRLLESGRERAAVAVRLDLAVLDTAPRPVHQLIRDIADELGDPDRLTGPDRDLAMRLEARIRYCGPGRAGSASAAGRLAGLGADPSVATGAERELLAVLLELTVLAGGTTAAQAARLACRILDREPASPGHVRSALPLLVTVLVSAEAFKYVSSWLESAEEQARDQHIPLEHCMIRLEQAFTLVHTGRLADARELVAEVNAADLAVHWDRMGSLLMPMAVSVAMATRDKAMAARLLACHDKAFGADGRLPQAMFDLVRVSATADGGDPAATLAQILHCGRQLDRSGLRNPALFPWRLQAARVCRQLDDRQQAVRLVEEQHALAVEWGSPTAQGQALRALGELTDGAKGLVALRDAVDILETSVNELELAKALWSLGIRLRATGQPGHHGAYARAHRLALSCRATTLGERISRDSIGQSATAEPGDAGALTKAERRVAELAAGGRTNPEIAAVLGVSLRAVEKHLTNCYRKLRVRGRSELPGVPGIAGTSGT